jgi:SAM-dependent methyltransferase
MDFSNFDKRHYRTLGVREGYSEWAATYERVVEDEMDIRLLLRLATVDWERARRVLDLACGTGRIGAWLHGKGVRKLDGVDFTPEMLAVAESKRVYDRLHLADVLDTKLPAAGYDLILEVLADEHIADLAPLYREAARLAEPGGTFVVVGYHSHFLMIGVPTHFNRAGGEPVAVESHVHLFSEHVKAAHRSGWTLAEMDEGVIDEAWLAKKPKWEKYRFHPVSFSLVWKKPMSPSPAANAR